MQKLAGLNRSDGVGIHGNQCYRCPATIDEFDLVSTATLIDVDNRADISSTQFFVWGVAIKNHQRMFSNH